MSHATTKNYIVGVYDDEDVLVSAVRKVREAGIKIQDAYTPFPVHGLDDALGYHYSTLSIAAFLFGATGTCFALTMIIGMIGVDWPMDIGGKPNFPIPNYIPITFEMTVLLSALGMTGTFFAASNLHPFATPNMIDPRSTDDKFILAIDVEENTKLGREKISSVLRDTGASEINTKTI